MLCGCVIDVNGMNGAHVADGWAGDDKRRAHNSLINTVVVAGVVINMWSQLANILIYRRSNNGHTHTHTGVLLKLTPVLRLHSVISGRQWINARTIRKSRTSGGDNSRLDNVVKFMWLAWPAFVLSGHPPTTLVAHRSCVFGHLLLDKWGSIPQPIDEDQHGLARGGIDCAADTQSGCWPVVAYGHLGRLLFVGSPPPSSRLN